MNKPAKSAAPHPPSARGILTRWPYALLAGVLFATVAFVIVNHFGSNSSTGAGQGGAITDRGLPVGTGVPVIALKSTQGTTVSLDQLRGSKVVVYFYESSG